MLTVRSYTLPEKEHFSLEIPQGTKILTVQERADGKRGDGKPRIWALVNTDRPGETRYFLLVGTANPIKADEKLLNYIGSPRIEGGTLTCHLFEIREKQPES